MAALKKTRDEIMDKAEGLGIEYEKQYGGCGQSTFLAILDSLRWGGLEIASEEVEDLVFPGMCVMTGGAATSTEGSCGAVSGAVMAMGMALLPPRNEPMDENTPDASGIIRDTLIREYFKRYNSIICKEVQRKYFGKSWDFTRPDMAQEFLSITDGCTIKETARMTAGFILDEYEKGNVRT